MAERNRPAPDRHPAASTPSTDLATLGTGFALAAVAALTYANTLGHGFVWDDPISLQRWLPALQTWSSLFFPPPGIPQFPPDYYRPLQLLSYQFDRALGGGAAWPFHLSLVLLHTLATVLVWRVGLRLFATMPTGWWAAGWGAALFAVHPIHSESVAWMAARPDVMVSVGGLGALLAYWHAGWPLGRRTWIAAACVFLALLCKENAAALLILVPGSALVFPAAFRASAAPPRSRAERRRAAAPSVAPAFGHLIPFVIVAVLYFVLRFAGLSRMPPTALSVPDHPLSMFVAAAGLYLRLLLWPFPHNAYISDLSLDPLHLALSVVWIVLFLAVSWLAWQQRAAALLFALAWLGLTLVPSLAVVLKLPTAPVAERYLYLPSVGFCWAVGYAVGRIRQAAPGRTAQLALALPLSALLGLAMFATAQRNAVWADNFSLWSDTAEKNKLDALPMRSLAASTLERGDSVAAERLFHEALKRRNNTVGQFTIYNNLGSIALNRNDYTTAETYYRKAFALTPSADCLHNLGLIAYRRATDAQVALDDQQRHALLQEADKMFRQAVDASPHDAEIHVALGQTAQARGDRETARQHFRRALNLGLAPATAKAVQELLATP